MPLFQISLKNSELKTTQNTFRDCRAYHVWHHSTWHTQIKKERTKTRENVAHSLLIKNIHKVELLGVWTVDTFCFIDHLLLLKHWWVMILSYCSLQNCNMHPASSESYRGHILNLNQTTENFTYLVVTSTQHSFLRLCNFSGSWAVSLQILGRGINIQKTACNRLPSKRGTSVKTGRTAPGEGA